MNPSSTPTNVQPPALLSDEEHSKRFGVSWSAPSTYVALGLCQLNQWALDFNGNLERIQKSIRQVKALGGYYRCGPELEVCGYSCDDHFSEGDTTAHCWQSLIELLRGDFSHNCLVDVGMPVEFKSVRYNCRIFMLNGQIVLIRPKMFLANDGAYRETRWFGAWPASMGMVEFVLPKSVQRVNKQQTCPFGFAAIQCNDCILASETCEELFVPESPHLAMCLAGVDIFSNGSASYYEIGKLRRRLDLIMAPTQKMGGIYLYCNLKGNDGGRLAFDGASFIACNGKIVSMIEPFQINDVEVVVEHININKVRSYRASNPSYTLQASSKSSLQLVKANIWLSGAEDNSSIRVLQLLPPTDEAEAVQLIRIGEELARGAACWLWDYLRRSRAQGFFLPLSGGADSSSVAAIVRIMCDMVFRSVQANVDGVIPDIERVLRRPRDDPAFPKDGKSMCYLILHTAYLGTHNSSAETRERARNVSEQLGSYHVELDMDHIVKAEVDSVASMLNFRPRFMHGPEGGGSTFEDLSLQNIQARSRMATGYMLAMLLPLMRGVDPLARPPMRMENVRSAASLDSFPELSDEQVQRIGFLITLSTGNIDEGLRGYFTKYDCSSADINPIGSMSKCNLRRLLAWAEMELNAPVFGEILEATPTAELRPAMTTMDSTGNSVEVHQTDEEEMGLSYTEIKILGRLRKMERCGPVEMYETLIQLWRTSGGTVRRHAGSPVNNTLKVDVAEEDEDPLDEYFKCIELTPKLIGEKVKHFFRTHCANRHKSTILPPSYHCEAYDADDSRFDWRPCLYPDFQRQFEQIDKLVELSERAVRQMNRDPTVTERKHVRVHEVITSSK